VQGIGGEGELTMTTRNALFGLLGLGLMVATPATAKADFGFSFRYGGGCRPVYYDSCGPAYYSSCAPAYYSGCAPVVYERAYYAPVVYRSYPRYTTRYYGGRYYGRGARAYYRD
jgi:hypothetical protein